MWSALKRSHPTMDEDFTANSHSIRLLRDSKKVRSKSDSGVSVEEVFRIAVNSKIINHSTTNKDVLS